MVEAPAIADCVGGGDVGAGRLRRHGRRYGTSGWRQERGMEEKDVRKELKDETAQRGRS